MTSSTSAVTPPLAAVVMAAGEGTRMHSDRPKPLHRLCGRPMVLHVLHALAGLPLERAVVVVGHGAERVTKSVGQRPPDSLKIDFVEQRVQRGTGDALAVALTDFSDTVDDDDVIVVPGDTPLLRTETLARLHQEHVRSQAAVTVLTCRMDDPTGYGRIVRDKKGSVARIVEQADASAEERAIDEVNTSIYVFKRSLATPALRRLNPENAQGEYYLTDVVAVLSEAGYSVASVVAEDAAEAAGVNDRVQLAVVEKELRKRINLSWLRRGVTMLDPDQTYLDTTVDIGRDVTIYPGALLQGETRIGPGSEIGPTTQLVDSTVGSHARVSQSVGHNVTIGDDAIVGPWVYLPPGTEVTPGTVIRSGPAGNVPDDIGTGE